MTIKEASQKARLELEGIYDKREAQNIVELLFEDLFEIRNLERNETFFNETELEEALARLGQKEPIQHVTGKAHFYGFQFKVNRHVLIPRPETEELVHWVLQDVKDDKKQVDILDIGLGSGCIALTLKKKHPRFRMFGLEMSMDALNVARINSRRLGVDMTFYRFNFLDQELWRQMGLFDIIVSNPPYIKEEDRGIMANNVLLYEPEEALFAGSDPLIFYKAIHSFAQQHLKSDGKIYLEIHEDLSQETADIFSKSNSQIEIRKDMQGKDRMMKVKL